MKLWLLEPEPEARWAPFAGVRPLSEMRAGAWRIRDRWNRATGVEAAGVLGHWLEHWTDVDAPPVVAPRAIDGPAFVARSDFAPAAGARLEAHGARRLVHDGLTVGWRLAGGDRWTSLADDSGEAEPIDGVRLRGAYDLVTALEQLLEGDCASVVGSGDPLPSGSIVFGDSAHVVLRGAQPEPGVVYDVRHGPVVLEQNVEVRYGTRLEGPLWAGPGTKLLGGHVRGSAFGPRCNVHGEVATTVFVGYANKSHDGFVGHSVLGHWVNLGAGTITSNLKNTYGEIRLEPAGERIATGRSNLGTLFGDHAKTAIGTMLPTGAIVSAGANVFGGGPVAKLVPPFAWGGAGDVLLDEAGFLRVAERVMPRRDVAFTDERRAALAAIYRRLVT
jgi:UDP-N-acetylglucosamine diphosphorylase / glucose-1-phosphate thymidylyltransferase / UDP-N-acetylgalactosamine diphosphorylase / glucosamine-1-phosphate N-acetyltransferase / galactosamine-1-phosphate N-acetyltransferase